MVGLTVFSLVSGVAMLYVFKWTSDQEGIDLVKRKIYAGIFEIRLFNDDMRAIMSAQRDIFRYNLRYLRLSLRPLLFMIVPFVLIIAQLQLHYGYQGLAVDEPVIVKVTLVAPAGPGDAGGPGGAGDAGSPGGGGARTSPVTVSGWFHEPPRHAPGSGASHKSAMAAAEACGRSAQRS